jgi:Suv3-like DEXQ box helicase/helicase-like protein/degradasome RNA helicase subunit
MLPLTSSGPEFFEIQYNLTRSRSYLTLNMPQSSPAAAGRSDSPPIAINFDSWLNHARAGRGLPPSPTCVGKGNFNSWLSSAWPGISPLPEASDLTLIRSGGQPRVAVAYQTVVTVLGLHFPVCLHTSLDYHAPESEERVGDFFCWAQSRVVREKRRLKQKADKFAIRLSRLVADYPGLLAADIENAMGEFGKPLNRERFAGLAGEACARLKQLGFNRQVASGLDLPRYHEAFPQARARGRNLSAIFGPTNSGKTYTAFQKLAKAKSGVYLAPLRLMAAEAWDTLMAAGVNCSLITGEERIIDPFATHVCSTIEMMNPSAEYEVAVIDEVQMISDCDRGWAWTQAVVGVNAREVIMAGSPDALGIVTALAHYMGEPLEISTTKRLCPLTVAPIPLRSMGDASSGSAFISFSRRNVLEWKQQIGEERCAAVYGALSPEVRREEARRFADKQVEFVSATDAIGLGINLPIHTVVFTTLRKWDGTKNTVLSQAQIRQIAGRAGRYGLHEYGVVTALNQEDLEIIREAIHAAPEPVAIIAPVAPHLAMVEYLARQSGQESLLPILTLFRKLPIDEHLFSKADLSSMCELAGSQSLAGLPLETQFKLCACPLNTRDPGHLDTWIEWVKAIRAKTLIKIPGGHYFPPLESTTSDEVLKQAEARVKLLSAYRWMHYRFSEVFPDLEAATSESAQINQFIANSLKEEIVRQCNRCAKPLPQGHQPGICDRCRRKSNHHHFHGRN